MSLLQALAESKRRVSRLERSAREESTSSKSQPGDASSASLSMSKKSGGEVQDEVNREEECNSHGRKGEKDAVSELFFDVKQVIDELHALVSAGEQKRLVSKLRVLIDDESLLLSSRIAAVKSECARLEADNAMLSARAEDAEMLVTHTARESEETVEKISALWEKRLESQQKAAEKNWKESRREWEREEAKLRASFREELERERADAQQLLSKIEAEMKEEKERAEEEKSRLEAEMEEEKERMKAAADREKKEVEDRYQLEKDRLFALHQSAMLKLKEKREEDGKTWRSEKEKVREKIDKMRQRLDGVEKSRDKLRAEVEEEKEKRGAAERREENTRMELERMREELAKSKAENARLEERVEQFKRRLTEREQDEEARMEAVEKRVKDIMTKKEKKYAQLEHDYKRLQKQVFELTSLSQ